MPRHDTAKRTRGLIAASAAAVLTTGLIASSASADPEITPEDVAKALHEVSAINEKVQAVSGDIEATQDEIADLKAEISDRQGEYDARREVLGQSVVQRQIDAPLGETVSLFASEDPEAFLDGLGAKIALDTQRSQELEHFVEIARALENRQVALNDREAELLKSRKALEETQAERQAQHDRAEEQLAELNAEQQDEATGVAAAEDLSDDIDLSKVSGKGAKAVAFARAQVGDAYSYGGTGPDAWDCSGLTQAAWGAAGVSIPRVAGDQYAAGQDVPLSAVQPGDLVFYADMSHVGIYVGNGQVVHAANPRTGTNVTSIGENFAKAARVG